MEEKTIKELQEYVNAFVNDREWQTPAGDILIHIVEELGEVARNVLHIKNYGGQHTNDKENNMDEELADLLYLLLKMSNACDVNLGKAFTSKMEKNAKRFPVKE